MNEEELENMLEQGNPSVFTQVKKFPNNYVRGMTSTRLTNFQMQIMNFDILYSQNEFNPIETAHCGFLVLGNTQKILTQI